MIWESKYRLTRSWIRYQTKWELYFQQEQATRQAIPRETPLGVDKKKKELQSELFSKTHQDGDELQGVKGGLKKRNQERGLWAQREPAIHTDTLKWRQMVRKVCVQNIACGGRVLLISECLQYLHESKDYAGSTNIKWLQEAWLKVRKWFTARGQAKHEVVRV